jgi:hypothetical protein
LPVQNTDSHVQIEEKKKEKEKNDPVMEKAMTNKKVPRESCSVLKKLL